MAGRIVCLRSVQNYIDYYSQYDDANSIEIVEQLRKTKEILEYG